MRGRTAARCNGHFMKQIQAKIDSCQRLSLEDGLALLQGHDLVTMGKLARQVKLRKSGRAGFLQ